MQAMLRKRRMAWDFLGFLIERFVWVLVWVWASKIHGLLTTRVIIQAGQRMCKNPGSCFHLGFIAFHSCIVEKNHGLLTVLMSGK